MLIPWLQSDNQDLSLLQTKWRSILNPFLSNPSLQSQIMTGVLLSNGTTVINHKLGQKLTGWRVIGINAAATIYDAQASNQTPDVTLVLISNSACTITLEVF